MFYSSLKPNHEVRVDLCDTSLWRCIDQVKGIKAKDRRSCWKDNPHFLPPSVRPCLNLGRLFTGASIPSEKQNKNDMEIKIKQGYLTTTLLTTACLKN